MSWEASVWALKQAPVDDCQQKMVLMGLADHASDTGQHAFPTRRTLAEYACCSVRTVSRHLADLEAKGLISRGDQQLVDHIPTYLRPTVWDLNMAMRKSLPGDNVTPGQAPPSGASDPVTSPSPGDTPDTPPVSDVTPPRCQERHPPRDTGDTSPVTLVAHITSLEPPIEINTRTRAERVLNNQPAMLAAVEVPHGRDYDAAFLEFCRAYPDGNEDQPRSWIEWGRAKRRVRSPQIIIAAAQRYRDDPNRDPAFTKAPWTWLANDGWNNPACRPKRSLDRPRSRVKELAPTRTSMNLEMY